MKGAETAAWLRAWKRKLDTLQLLRDAGQLPPLDTNGVLWVAAIDRVPIEDRVEWVALMKQRVDSINAGRAR